MGLFGFGKKKEEKPAPLDGPPVGEPEKVASIPASPKGTPTEQVLSMQQQGMSQEQIVQNLKNQGYNSSQIFDAMNQASAKGGVGAPAPPGPGGPPPPPPPGGGAMPPPPPPGGAMMPAPGAPAEAGGERFEEIAESIVDEKFKEFEEEFKKVKAKQDANSEIIAKLQQSVTDLKSGMDNLHKAIVSKIGEYDQNLLSVGTEIKAMEKVFSKVLPTFTENINELARVTNKMKGGPKK